MRCLSEVRDALRGKDPTGIYKISVGYPENLPPLALVNVSGMTRARYEDLFRDPLPWVRDESGRVQLTVHTQYVPCPDCDGDGWVEGIGNRQVSCASCVLARRRANDVERNRRWRECHKKAKKAERIR